VAVSYVDTSALVKLLLDEAHSSAFRLWALDRSGGLATSGIARVELARVPALRDAGLEVAARELLDSIDLIDVLPSILERASRVSPPELRSLDAIHLASALSLEEDLHGVVTYDRRLADAARANGVQVAAPI
jgi:predicted nucleic acid-binding protein